LSDPSSPIDPRDLELLRKEQPAPSATKARVRAKLAAVIPSMSEGGHGGDGSGGTGPDLRGSAAASRLGAKWSAMAASFVVGGIMGAALCAGLIKGRPPEVVYVDRPVPALASAISAPPASADTTGVAAVAATAAVSVPRPVSFATHLSQLSAERMVLDDARGALVQHDAQRALDALDRHRRTFANALLAEERDAMQVQALVAAGRYDEARVRASAFRKRTRDSLFLPMVDAAIASIP